MCLQWSLATSRSGCPPSLTFTYNKLVFWPCGVGQDIIGFDHGRSLSIGNSKIIRSLRRISWRWWKDTVQCVLSAICGQECATGRYIQHGVIVGSALGRPTSAVLVKICI